LREGMTLVIAGRPNAGKSSLLNALAGTEAAIVTDIAGTTRDLLREHIQIDGMPLHVIDTAGLRESTDPVEAEGIRRAWQAIEQADLVLLLVDDQLGRGAEEQAILDRLPQGLEVLEVHNKIDLSGHAPGEAEGCIYLSARTGAGLDVLRRTLKQRMGYEGASGVFSARRRHLAALEQAAGHLEQAALHLAHRDGELLAEELRQAQQALEEITGRFTADDLLGEIFSSFCIGK
ncbi:MAG: GTP-binding protein, partial [Gammaproteobacteria bacterium]